MKKITAFLLALVMALSLAGKTVPNGLAAS